MRHTRTALDYVQIQRICLNLNIDTYTVFFLFQKNSGMFLKFYHDLCHHSVESREEGKKQQGCTEEKIRLQGSLNKASGDQRY